MAIVLMRQQPCGKCAPTPMCSTVERELQATIERLRFLEAKTGRKLPDITLFADCSTFAPPSRRRG